MVNVVSCAAFLACGRFGKLLLSDYKSSWRIADTVKL